MPKPRTLSTLVRSDIATMESYVPSVPFDVHNTRLGYPAKEIIKLDANENPYGPSPQVYPALANEHYYHVYPDPESNALREALSDYLGLDKSHIMVGQGADELIGLIMRLFIGPGDAIIDCPPTFGMYSFDASINGGSVLHVPRLADFSIDLKAIERAAENSPHAKLLFLASPNNPDGSILSDQELLAVLRLPLIVILDEAYIEFHGESRSHWVDEYSNLIVVRTFSKWAGLAGLRIGYGLFPEWIITNLWKIKQPYNVNVAGIAAALASLSDVEYLMQNVNKIITERERLCQRLSRFEFLHPYPSRANFILCHVIGRDAHQLKRNLEKRGILVRYFGKPGLTEHIRISIGRPEQNDALVLALAQVQDEEPDFAQR